MKKALQTYLLKEGMHSSYSGKEKTLFIWDVSQDVIDSWGITADFKIKSNN